MIKEVVILAGGLGTRLRETVPALPKSMAIVAGQPFLTYVIRHLLSQGIERFIFSLGYRHELIEQFLAETFPYIKYDCVIEESPLGTGGAIKLALEKTHDRDILIVNGDTLFNVVVDDLLDRHVEAQADCTLALKPLKHFDRYGAVDLDTEGNILKFKEKKYVENGLINGGVYLLNTVSFSKHKFPAIFSFENSYLEKYCNSANFAGVIQDKYFIDIGVPTDFERAQHELKYPEFKLENIDETWTLFLDRDGVINPNKDNSYVFNTSEFAFLPGAIEAIKVLSAHFAKLIIVTNQRGIGKGLMDDMALQEIHQHMMEEIEKSGGRIDAIYYCPIVDDKHHDRKPNPGMMLEAAHMYPDIDFARSIMIGDKISDMQLGRNVGAFTVLVSSSTSSHNYYHPDIDMRCNSLWEFAEKISNKI